MFKHILVPTDGSRLSSDTITRAISFAREAGAKITFFYAMHDYPMTYYGEEALADPTTPERFAEIAQSRADEILGAAETLAGADNVECASASAISDTPYVAIIEAADAAGADLIFMASHGRRGIAAFLLGSETQKVLTHTKIPVLIYR